MSDQDSKKISPFLVNGLSGAVQATLVTITGYPFDLVKGRLQSNKYQNSWQCVKGTVQNEGILGFYRGSAMPWLSHMVKRPIQYPLSEYLKSLLDRKNPSKLNNYIIGGATGLLGSIFGTPLQVIKVSIQTSTNNEVKNSYYFIRQTYQQNGLLGFYRGFIPTLFKDSLFGLSFIGNYYTFRDLFGAEKWWQNFINGAMAHCLTWFTLIPIDYVKTNVQRSQDPKCTPLSVIKNAYRQGGIRIFWAGVIPACLRTIPVSGVAMTGYEFVRKKLLVNSRD